MIIPKIVFILLRIAGPFVIEHVLEWVYKELSKEDGQKKLSISKDKLETLLKIATKELEK